MQRGKRRKIYIRYFSFVRSQTEGVFVQSSFRAMITRPGPISVLYRNVCSFPFPYNRNSSAKRSVSRRLIRPWFEGHERQWGGVRFARERKYFADRFSGRNFLSKLDPKFSNWATGLLARPYCSPLLFVIFETVIRI